MSIFLSFNLQIHQKWEEEKKEGERRIPTKSYGESKIFPFFFRKLTLVRCHDRKYPLSKPHGDHPVQ